MAQWVGGQGKAAIIGGHLDFDKKQLLGMLCTNPCVTCLSMGKAQTIST
jgi:hypothetical protein